MKKKDLLNVTSKFEGVSVHGKSGYNPAHPVQIFKLYLS